MSHEPKFNVGDLVQKHAGYRYPGIVRSRYVMPNGWRYDVEADHPDFKGMLHIFSGEQLELRPAAPPQREREYWQMMYTDLLKRVDAGEFSGKPGAEGREAIARKIAGWMGYGWDGLRDVGAVESGFAPWPIVPNYQGGKPDLLRLADAILDATCPACGEQFRQGQNCQQNPVNDDFRFYLDKACAPTSGTIEPHIYSPDYAAGREITDEMIERGARAHCPWAFEGASTEGRNIARAEASKEVREILTAALSVTRPDSNTTSGALGRSGE